MQERFTDYCQKIGILALSEVFSKNSQSKVNNVLYKIVNNTITVHAPANLK
jgi:hypothetical protein